MDINEIALGHRLDGMETQVTFNEVKLSGTPGPPGSAPVLQAFNKLMNTNIKAGNSVSVSGSLYTASDAGVPGNSYSITVTPYYYIINGIKFLFALSSSTQTINKEAAAKLSVALKRQGYVDIASSIVTNAPPQAIPGLDPQSPSSTLFTEAIKD